MNNSLITQAEYITKIKAKTEPTTKQIGGLDIICYPNVYAGGTDSELMVENMEIKPGDTVLDLCTGNGVIALSASKMGAKEVVGTDLNPNAIRNALANKQNLKAENVSFIEGNLFDGIIGNFDVITINPPYTNKKASDLTEICFWDEDNSVTKRFFRDLRDFLKPGGRAYIAWADFADQNLLRGLSADFGWNLTLLSSRIGQTGYRFDVYLVE